MYLTIFGSCSQLDNRTEGLDVAYSLVSVTDCRLMTFVSGNKPTHSGSSCKFSVARLLGDASVQRPSRAAKLTILCWLYDYYQFHPDSPVDAILGRLVIYAGDFYTINVSSIPVVGI